LKLIIRLVFSFFYFIGIFFLKKKFNYISFNNIRAEGAIGLANGLKTLTQLEQLNIETGE